MPLYHMTEGRHGRFLTYANDLIIGRCMQLYGEWSEPEIWLYRQIVRPGDVVVEPGANVGTHSVYLSKAVGPEGRLYAFEPGRLTHQLLCANIALNECLNVYTRYQAIGATVGRVRFPRLDPENPGNYGAVSIHAAMDDDSSDWVDVVSIDSLSLPRLDFIKCDIEGFEPHMLAGARNVLSNLRPVVYLELGGFSQDSPTGNRDELVMTLESFGYSAYYFISPLFNSENYRRLSVDIFNGGGASFDLICVPNDRAKIEGLSRARPGDDLIKVENCTFLHSTQPWNAARFVRRC